MSSIDTSKIETFEVHAGCYLKVIGNGQRMTMIQSKYGLGTKLDLGKLLEELKTNNKNKNAI